MTGDGSTFQKMMQTAQATSQQTLQAFQTATKQIEGMKQTIQGFANEVKGFASSAVMLGASFGLATSLKSAFQGFAEHQNNVIKMNAILEVNGRDVASVTKEYKRFAEQMVESTTLSKGEVFGLLKQAETMGFTGEKAEQLAKASIGLGAASEMSAQHAMTMVIALERGNVQMLRRVPALRGIHDQGQLVAKAQELMNMGMKEEYALSQTVTHQIEKLQRAFKEVSMEVGKLVTEAISPLVKIMTQAAKQFKELPDDTKKMIVYVSAATLAFLGLPGAISTVLFLLDAMGVTFVFNMGVQIVQLGLSTVAWAAWSAVVFLASLPMAAFNLGVAALNLLFGLFGGNLAMSILGMISWSSVTAIANGVLDLFDFSMAILNSLMTGQLAAIIGLIPSFFAWAGGMTVAKVATWLLNAALTVKNALLAGIPLVIGVVVIAFVAFVGIVLLAVAAVGAFTGALALVTGAAALLVAGVAIGMAVVVALSTAVVGIGGGLWNIVSGLLATRDAVAGLQGIQTIFIEWKGIIQSIVKALQIDMPLAWELVKASLQLAVAELKALWPPLWTFLVSGTITVANFLGQAFSSVFVKLWSFLQDGWSQAFTFLQTSFAILWELVKTLTISSLRMMPYLAIVVPFMLAFELIDDAFKDSIKKQIVGYGQLGKFIWDLIKESLTPGGNVGKIKPPEVDKDASKAMWSDLKKNMKEVFDPAGQFEKQKAAIEKAKTDLANAAKGVKIEMPDFLADLQPQVDAAQKRLKDALQQFGVEDNPEVQAARARVKQLQDEVEKRAEELKKKPPGTEGPFPGIAAAAKHANDIKAALSGSADALARINSYRDALSNMPVGSAGGAIGDAVKAAAGGEIGPHDNPFIKPNEVGAGNQPPVPVKIEQQAQGGAADGGNPVVAVLLRIERLLGMKQAQGGAPAVLLIGGGLAEAGA